MVIMKFKQTLLTTAAAATALFGMASAPAQAFNLNKSFTLDAETVFDFDFVESHGYFQSIVGLTGPGGNKLDLLAEVSKSDKNSSANDWQGTPGVAVTTTKKTVTLAAGTYSFFLDRVSDTGKRTTIGGYDAHFYNEADGNFVLDDRKNPLNLTSEQKWRLPQYSPSSKLALTPSSANSDPFASSILIGFEDFGLPGDAPHIDYNDMIIKAKATRVAAVPEPATLAGLGLVAGAAAFSGIRRRRANQPS